MKRDPFYQQIIRSLEGELDSEDFERCAQDLLRSIYPTLVPVRGGVDSGMDGAIADGEGSAYPLVCTTETDVIGNLTKSLDSYIASGGARRNVVLATSQALSPRRRRNLEKRAQEKKFTLIGIHDQAAMADLLYRSPEWCVELLGLTGKPPALSFQPKSTRPMITDELVGRQSDLEWLVKTQGDRLLVGQPGIGKTFLLYEYARQHNALFVNNDDVCEIAAELRRQKPNTLILDDAHVHRDLLVSLIHLRNQIHADFSILASSWPGEDEAVQECMGISSSSVRVLERQSRTEILKIINNAGIGGPNGLLEEILNQAEGRAGLAVTLCHLCINGDVWDVVKGDALLKSIRSGFKNMVSPAAFDMLAHFSIAGEMGIAMADVAKVLGTPDINVRREMAHLAAGGVLTTNQDRLSVRPRALRHVLVRDVFFGSYAPLNILPLLNITPSKEEVALTLAGAKYAGGKIPHDLMIRILEQANSVRAWDHYASIGADEARFVLGRYPQLVVESPHTFLVQVPEGTIPLLLQAAIGDKRELHSHPNHPLRQLEDWIKDANPGKPDVIRRREALLGGVLQWLQAGNDTDVGLHAIALALSPSFERHDMSPGNRNSMIITLGLVTAEDMKQILRRWKLALPVITQLPRNGDWGHLVTMIENWVYPSHGGKEDDSRQQTRRKCARVLLNDAVVLLSFHQGFLHRLGSLAHELEYRGPIPIEPEFETLFPIRRRERRWHLDDKKFQKAAEDLAKRWISLAPFKVARLISRYESEAREANLTNWPPLTTVIAEKIAITSTRPAIWLQALMRAGVSALLVEPFLRKMVAKRKWRWKDHLERCLADPVYRLMAITIVFQAEPVLPDDMLERTVLMFDGNASWLFRGELPLPIMRRLLNHPDPDVAASAAFLEWERESDPKVRHEIINEWRHAIVRYRHDSHRHRLILENHPDIGLDWLKGLTAEQEESWYSWETVKTVSMKLNAEQMREIIGLLQPKTILARHILEGILTDNQLYRDFLADPKWKREHLYPLEGFPDRAWTEKAILALDAGYTPWDVAVAAYMGGDGWRGNESDRLMEWIQAFQSFMTHDDVRLHEVAKEGIKIAEDRRTHALEREKNEEIYG